MKKAHLLFFFTTAAVGLWLCGCKLADIHVNRNFNSHLSSDQEVPSFNSKAHGHFSAEAREDMSELNFLLTAGQMNNVTGAHLHLGKPGENGPPVVTLFAGPKKAGEFNGTIAEGNITDANLSGPLQGRTVRELVDEIRRGNVYVNVHTDQHPDGEARGQIQD